MHENERSLLHHVVRNVSDVDSKLPALSELGTTIEVDEAKVWTLLEAATGDLTPIYDAAVLAAAVDGDISAAEIARLERLAVTCATDFHVKAVRDAAETWS